MSQEPRYPEPIDLTKPPFAPHFSDIRCGKGWEKLYRPVIDLCRIYGIEIIAINETLGKLCFYFSGDRRDEIYPIINAVGDRSQSTCEDCGEDRLHYYVDKTDGKHYPMKKAYYAQVNPHVSHGVRKTLCDRCRKIRQEKMAF